MAGDWIKMRGGLFTHPKVIRIAREIESCAEIGRKLSTGFNGALCEIVTRDVTRDVTVASLMRVWCAANEHTNDGVWRGIELEDLDHIAGIVGFGAIMEMVGWAVYDPEKETVTFPNFLEYNAPAKSGRGSASAERQRRYREKQRNSDASRNVTRNVTRDVTRDVTVTPREEKRRVEKNIEETSPFSPDGGVSEETGKTLPVEEPEVKPEPPAVSKQQQQAEQIYSAYPKKAGRQEALKHIKLCLKAAAFDHLLERTQAYAAAVAAWPASDRQYIPDPERWFKKGKYDDDPVTWQRTAGGPHWQSSHGPEVREIDYSKGF